MCNYYGDSALDLNAKPFFETDDQKRNLLSGLPQKIACFEKLSDDDKTDWFNCKPDCASLTDGIYATSPQCGDSAFFRFTRGGARSVIYDLGCLCAVDGAKVGVLKENATAVKAPARICVQLSENGTDWQTVGEITNLVSDKESDIIRKEIALDKAYKARFAKFTFPVTVHVFIDQFELFGTRNGANACEIVADSPDSSDYPDVYCTEKQLGAKDVLLAYFCLEGKDPISKEIFLPHVAYIDKGEIKDTLFDSYLFLPYVAFLYDRYDKRPLTKKDWQFYIDQQYLEGFNMDALDAAAAEVGEKLGIKDYKVSVFLSIFYPVTKVKDFGIVDGKNLDLSLLEDRKAALKWFIDEQLKGFYAKKYEHITLNGFYWFTEEINYGDLQLLELLRYTTDYVREKNLITTWIPYFHATGYDDWRHLGFDMACYQPNYAFNQAIPDVRLFDAAKTAKLLGMCIELESGGTENWNVERIKKYYAAGALTGYMKEAAHMYYQGGVPGDFYAAYKSDEEYLHSVYDDTYKFIKGTFDPNTVKFNEEDLLK